MSEEDGDTKKLLQDLMANQRLMQDMLAKVQQENAALRQQVESQPQEPQPTNRVLRELAVQAMGNEEGNVHYRAVSLSKDEEWRRMESEGGRLG